MVADAAGRTPRTWAPRPTLHIGYRTPGLLEASDTFLAHFHAGRCLAANPDVAALHIECLDTETLAILSPATEPPPGAGPTRRPAPPLPADPQDPGARFRPYE